MSFYVGDYLLLQDRIDPKHDSDSWSLPDISALSGHMGDTSNVEELLIKPEDMTLIPTQIQYGFAEWSADEGWEPDHDAYKQFYVRTHEAFYVQRFTAGTNLYKEFYVRQEAFYVQQWTSGTALYKEFYVRQEPFYVHGWTSATNLYSQFYVRQEQFYVRQFNPVSFWIEFYPTDFA